MSAESFEFASCGACLLRQGDECRRKAPNIAADTGRAIWPLVAMDDWCGEFLGDPRRPAPPPDGG